MMTKCAMSCLGGRLLEINTPWCVPGVCESVRACVPESCMSCREAAAMTESESSSRAQGCCSALGRSQLEEWCAWRRLAWRKPRRPDQRVAHGDAERVLRIMARRPGVEVSFVASLAYM